MEDTELLTGNRSSRWSGRSSTEKKLTLVSVGLILLSAGLVIGLAVEVKQKNTYYQELLECRNGNSTSTSSSTSSSTTTTKKPTTTPTTITKKPTTPLTTTTKIPTTPPTTTTKKPITPTTTTKKPTTTPNTTTTTSPPPNNNAIKYLTTAPLPKPSKTPNNKIGQAIIQQQGQAQKDDLGIVIYNINKEVVLKPKDKGEDFEVGKTENVEDEKSPVIENGPTEEELVHINENSQNEDLPPTSDGVEATSDSKMY